MDTIVEGDLLKVQISAALFANPRTSRNKWQKGYVGHWTVPEGAPPPRVEISFAVDIGTRTVAFGALYLMEQTGELKPAWDAFETTVTTLNLSHMPVHTSGEVFAKARNGNWVSMKMMGEDLFMVPHHPRKRLPNGFLGYDSRTDPKLHGPSVTLNKFDLDKMAPMVPLAPENALTVELRDSIVGRLGWGGRFFEDYDPLPLQFVMRAVLQLRLAAAGLEFAYQLYVQDLDLKQKPYQPGWLEELLIVPWEVLILRYPEFRFKRLRMLKALESAT